MPCICENKELPIRNIGIGTIPNTISEWQEHLALMYPNNFSRSFPESLEFITARLLEESAELLTSTDPRVSREISDLSHHDNPYDMLEPYRGELADVLAWNFAAAEVLNKLTGNYSVEQSLREQYRNGCAYCRSLQCICPKEISRFETLHQWQTL